MWPTHTLHLSEDAQNIITRSINSAGMGESILSSAADVLTIVAKYSEMLKTTILLTFYLI